MPPILIRLDSLTLKIQDMKCLVMYHHSTINYECFHLLADQIPPPPGSVTAPDGGDSGEDGTRKEI